MNPLSATDDFSDLLGRLEYWLTEHALPLWAEKGVDRCHGGFFDLIDQNGQSISGAKRGRVQGRQSWVYALAGTMGWKGPWTEVMEHGLGFAFSRRRADGQLPTLMAVDGSVLNPNATLYDQTFFLLAMAEARKHFPERTVLRRVSGHLLQTIVTLRRHAEGGFVESNEQPFQSNPHMHLLEAALAWAELEPNSEWEVLADEIAQLGISRLLDKNGAIREFYDSSWRPLAAPAGRSVEPGHQFEWAWLLTRWGRRRHSQAALSAARRLFGIGCFGLDPNRDVATDELDDSFRVARSTARLWPQTERIKSALLLMGASESQEDRARYRAQAFAATKSVWGYLQTPLPGLWRDRMMPDGKFMEEPAPASSFYHIICAIKSLRDSFSAEQPASHFNSKATA